MKHKVLNSFSVVQIHCWIYFSFSLFNSETQSYEMFFYWVSKTEKQLHCFICFFLIFFQHGHINVLSTETPGEEVPAL